MIDAPAAEERVTPIGHQTQPPARFSEAALVKMLEKEGHWPPLYLRLDHWNDRGSRLRHAAGQLH